MHGENPDRQQLSVIYNKILSIGIKYYVLTHATFSERNKA